MDVDCTPGPDNRSRPGRNGRHWTTTVPFMKPCGVQW
jgi:hypothetical protein